MTVDVSPSAPSNAFPGKALRRSAGFWFVVMLLGQLAFALYVALFYGGAAAGGQFEAWNKVLVGGWVKGGHMGNAVLGAHLLFAVVITLGGPLQLLTRLKARSLPLHRWNGRLYMVLALVMSLGGIAMVWTRGTAGGVAMQVGISLNGVLIVAAAVLAWRAVLARRIDAHRRWALRTFVLVSGVWFFRVGLMAWILANRGPVGVGEDFDGSFVRGLAFGCYLIPLAALELYLRAADSRATAPRLAMAAGLVALTLVMALGIVGAGLGLWLPRVA